MKKIVTESGEMEIIGNNHWIEIFYELPDNVEDGEYLPCFYYKGNRYFLSEFMDIHNRLQEFNGMLNFTYFSGILIKISETGEAIKAYTFYC